MQSSFFHMSRRHKRRRRPQPNQHPPPPPPKPSVPISKAGEGGKYEKILVGLICILAIAVYWNSLDGEFVHDDIVSVVRNPDVRANTGLTQMWFNDYWGMPVSHEYSHKSYRPLTVLTFRANYAMSNGRSSVPFHATNILIHTGCCVLLFLVSHQVLKMKLLSSFIVSIMFAVHPIHTEAVAGITGRSDALACFLSLISFYLYTKSILRDGPRNGLDWKMIASGFIGCSAMLAKETGITIMGINTFFDLYLNSHVVRRWWRGKGPDHSQSQLKRRLLFTGILILVSLGARIGIMNGTLPNFGPQDNPAAAAEDPTTRFLTYAFLPVFNVWLMFCPSRLSYDWQMGSIPLVESLWDPRNLSSAFFYLLYISILKRALKKGRNSCVFVAILFLSLPYLPASNLLFPVGFVAAERILYTPSIGVCILTAHGMELLRRRIPRLGNFLLFSLSLMLMSFTVKTWERNAVWRSRSTLFESGLVDNPGNAKVHYNYANLQRDLGNPTLAEEHYKTALRLWPDYASALNNLGAMSSDRSVAEQHFLRAIRANDLHNGAHFNLAVIYMLNENYEESIVHLDKCLHIDPTHLEALQYLGACYNVLNKTREAEAVFHKLITSDPSSKFHTNFASILSGMGYSLERVTEYLLASTRTSFDIQALLSGAQLKIEAGESPGSSQPPLVKLEFDPGVAYSLAIDYKERGKYPEANLLFEKLSEDSNSVYKIHYAEFLVKVRKRTQEAIEVLKLVPPADPNHPTALLLLAQLYENANKTGEAFEVLHSALHFFCPHDPRLCGEFYSQLGNLMHTTGAVLSAANYYRLALRFDPTSIQAHANIGAIYHLMTDFRAAHFHYLAALKLEPNHEVILGNMKKLETSELQSQSEVGAELEPTCSWTEGLELRAPPNSYPTTLPPFNT